MVKPTLKLLILALFIASLAHTQDSIVVITSQKFDKPVLDVHRLTEHKLNNNQVVNFVVNTHSLDQSEVKIIKSVLKSAGVKQENVNSFIMKADQLEKSISPILSAVKEVGVHQIAEQLVKNHQAVVYFTKRVSNGRLLAQTGQQSTGPSNLFANMTPLTLSALFVGLFLIVMLGIAISCLYDIKTNDSFAKNNLLVGRES